MVHAPGYTGSEELQKRLKVFRQFNRVNTDRNFKNKFWILEDEKLAKDLGIQTIGDIFLIKEVHHIWNPQSKSSSQKQKISVADFPFTKMPYGWKQVQIQCYP